MSDERRIAKVSEKEKFKASHKEQLHLLDQFQRGYLSVREFVDRFGEAAGFRVSKRELMEEALKMGYSPIHAVWGIGGAEMSIFANLPSEYVRQRTGIDKCYCPMYCNEYKPGTFRKLPHRAEYLKYASREVFEEFSRIQLEARFGSG